MTSVGNALKLVRTMPTKSHVGTVIFLPGAGMTGYRLRGWIRAILGRDMSFPHLKVVYPTAPLKFYTPWKGKITNVWFDRQGKSVLFPIEPQSLNESLDLLLTLVHEELAEGIPITKIIIGGFSMGGVMALQICYRTLLDVAGVFALSSFLKRKSEVYKALRSSDVIRFPPPLFMSHGERDKVVPYRFGRRTFENLTALGIEGHFHTVQHGGHRLGEVELLLLARWIKRITKHQ